MFSRVDNESAQGMYVINSAPVYVDAIILPDSRVVLTTVHSSAVSILLLIASLVWIQVRVFGIVQVVVLCWGVSFPNFCPFSLSVWLTCIRRKFLQIVTLVSTKKNLSCILREVVRTFELCGYSMPTFY